MFVRYDQAVVSRDVETRRWSLRALTYDCVGPRVLTVVICALCVVFPWG
jgi:hypothetical protein